MRHGEAEQNMMSVAGGLASSGKYVFVYGQSAHSDAGMGSRSRYPFAFANLSVTILSLGGPSMWRDGPTHLGGRRPRMYANALQQEVEVLPSSEMMSMGWWKAAYHAKTLRYIRFDKHMPPDEGIPVNG